MPLFSRLLPLSLTKPIVLAGLAGLLLAGLSSTLSAASNGNEAAREAFAKAQDYRASGDIRSARIELMNAIKSDPQWIDVRIFQAEILLNLFDGIGAEAELKRAFELGLEPVQVRHLYGHALQLQGKWNEAKEQLFANDIAPEHQAYAARIAGRVGLQTGDDLLATQAFDAAIRLDPQNSDLWVDVARFRAGSGDQAGAIAAVDEAVRLQPNNIRGLQYRGELIRFQFGLSAALPWFERGLQIDPNDVALLTEYAATLGDMGRMKDMLTIVRKIIALDGRNPRAFFMQAVLAARAGQYDLARSLMQKTEGRLDSVPAVLLVQGIIEHGEANYNAAIDKFRQLIAQQPNNRQAQNLLARSLYMAGDEAETVAVLERQVSNSGADPYALWLAGRALESMEKRGRAIDLLNRAARHDAGKKIAFAPSTPLGVLQAEANRAPNNAAVVIPYIRTLYNQGNFAGAFAQAKRLQNGNPGASDAHLLVADTAMALGNWDEALDALNKARTIRFSEPVMLRMIEALRAKGALQESGEVLAQYLRYNPSNVAGLRWMAYAHLETENWSVARRILENLRKRIGDNDALLMAGLAQAYTGLGQTDEAVQAGRIAYEVQPASPVVSHLYGLALLAQGTRIKDAHDLIAKAVTIMPQNATYRQSLTKAALALENESVEKRG
ncbi:MAG: tetratricopeptide repeat protein [Parasphingorhabdus sp.]|uniref:tetratricopeptide repeat protein n=1 Tax=Parasphingorhabdus sp. TaxID=2709688 RepID=UPI00329937B2